MRTTAMLLAVFMTACGTTTFRQETALAVSLKIADVGTTQYALQQPGLSEGNPALQNQATSLLLQAGVTAGVIWYSHRLKERGDPRWRWPLRIYSAVSGFATGWNLYQIAKEKE